MAEEPEVNQPSSDDGKVKKLSKELRGLKEKYQDIRRELYEKKKKVLAWEEEHPRITHPLRTIDRTLKEPVEKEVKKVVGSSKYLKYGKTGEVPEKDFYILVQDKNGEWSLYGRYSDDVEYKSAIQKIKEEKRKKWGKIKNYYVTFSRKEVDRFLKVSKYREQEYHREMRKEISRLPTGKWSANVKEGWEIPKEKTISREVAQYSGYSGKPSGMIPRMSVGVFGSISQPKRTNLPEFGSTQSITKQQIKKTIVDHQQFKELMDSGYSREDLENQGIFDKQSKYFVQESVFGKGVVPYRPISMNQSFLRVDLPKTIYQRRQETGLPYENFKPFSIGTIDPVTGERKTNYKFPKVYL